MFSELKKLRDLEKNGKITKRELAEKVAEVRLPDFAAKISRNITTPIILLVWIIPSVSAMTLFSYSSQQDFYLKFIGFLFVPLVFILSFIITAGFFGQLAHKGIIEGKFPRIPEHPIYALRRIYGTALTQVYYFKPLYAICLAVPVLKKLLFRMFGYRGNLSFTIYPDSWLRDFTQLKIAKGSYLANRCTVGTNICLEDGSILVGPVDLAEDVLIGHLSVLALSLKIGKKSMIGTGAIVGIRSNVGINIDVGPRAGINHAVTLSDNCKIGSGAIIGLKCIICCCE